MRIALYARKSSESVDRQVQSLEDQFSALMKLADRENLNIVEVLQEARSAKAPSTRPEFQRLLDLINASRIDGILTWSINRLARNPVDGGMIAYLLQTGKLQMIRTIERTYLPEDNALVLSIETGMATSYLQDLNRNVSRGMNSKAERGWHVCKAPLGYLNNPMTRQIDKDPDRFELVRGAWSKLLSGNYSVAQIHRELLDAGLTVKNLRRRPRPVSRAAVYGMFKNPFYCGEIQFNGKRLPGKHKAVVSKAEFERAQSLISKSSGLVRRKLPQPFPFARVFTCGECGCAVVGERKRKFYPRTGRFAEYIYYHCSGSKGCAKRSASQKDLTSTLEQLIEAVRIPRELGDWLQTALGEALSRGEEHSTAELMNIKGEIEGLQRKQRKLTLMRLADELNETEFKALRKDLETEASELETRAESLQQLSSRIVQRGHDLIDAAMEAGELPCDGSYLSALGGVAKRLGANLFVQGEVKLRPNPIYAKIACFEPAEACSSSPKQGDLVPLNSSWWALVDDLLKLLSAEVAQQMDELAQRRRK